MSVRESNTVEIDARGLDHRVLNERVRAALEKDVPEIVLRNVCGQRYIGAGLTNDAAITIHGVPGNDLACFMTGPRVSVHGNAQDGAGNTMSAGSIAVHGHAGDVLAYSMRGGRVLVRDRAGYRAGIHMKAYGDLSPVVVVGGTVRDYAGEYMAGGTLVVLGIGRSRDEPLAGDFLGTGMHGGDIYLRGSVFDWQLGREVGRVPIDDAAWEWLMALNREFARVFGIADLRFDREEFTHLKPVSHRPYGRIYVH
ncbi:MAG: hypothetical protein JXO72_14430 [Vicinamibacteria bacterium]|nr:hypothetical protein [Vicinamibacteria bacterium]